MGNIDAELWDRQIEADAKNGKLGSLANRALRDHEAGDSTELPPLTQRSTSPTTSLST